MSTGTQRSDMGLFTKFSLNLINVALNKQGGYIEIYNHYDKQYHKAIELLGSPKKGNQQERLSYIDNNLQRLSKVKQMSRVHQVKRWKWWQTYEK